MENDERRTAQRGEGKFGGILSLAAFLAFCYALWNVAPIYMANYALGDKMIEVCRLHPSQKNEEAIRELLMRYVREEQLDAVHLQGILQDPDPGHRAQDHAGLRARGQGPARMDPHVQVQPRRGPAVLLTTRS